MESPARIGRYLIEQELGRGMMGVVWRATDPELGRTVALKTVHLAFAVTPEEAQTFERRFLAEARAAARLTHPAIVVVHDVGRDAGSNTLYIAFEHLRGRTLAEVAAAGPLPWRQALKLGARVADALHHAHGLGVVHRDVKPANIMLLDSGEPKVMDFGIAKLPAERLTSTGQFFGTPSYMSPEQASGEALDGRSDLFSLAAVLYLLLTGRTAFEGDSVPATLSRILFKDPPEVRSLAPDLPAGVEAILDRALAKKAADRYPDARAFASDLEAVLAGRQPAIPAARPSSQGTMVSSGPIPAPTPAPPPASLPRAAPAPVAAPSEEPALPLPGLRRLGRREVAWGVGGLLGVAVLLSVLGVRMPGVGSIGVAVPVEINLEHSLRSGTLRVFVDDDLALEESIESWVKEDLLVMKVRKGRLTKTFPVPAGERSLRLEVEGDGFRGSRTVEGRFEAGEPRRLEARVGGLVKKDLSAWLAAPRRTGE